MNLAILPPKFVTNVLTYVCDYRQVYKACWHGQLYMYVMYIRCPTYDLIIFFNSHQV